jgi:hypothetical protein
MKTGLNGKPLETNDIPTEIGGGETGKSKSKHKIGA